MGDLRTRLDSWRRTKLGRYLVIFAFLMLLGLSVTAPASYKNVKIYFTGDRVTATVAECVHYVSRRGSSAAGYHCTGEWTLKNGARRSGRLLGLDDDKRWPAGRQFAMRADNDVALAPGIRPLVMFGLGLAAQLLLVTWIVLWVRRRRRNRG
ncbi:hypothetical protein [Nocardia sp. NPDC051832]|uniref:hypothetical protein n=1 Tax=Nocardia sp. NPDC051832 TaxID=3155673 RepID=UPI00343F4AFE